MRTLSEIQTAADSLSSEEKEELLRFLATRLREERSQSPGRIYSEGEIGSMFAEDKLILEAESDVRLVQKGKMLVITGLKAPFDAVAAIQADREERDETIARRIRDDENRQKLSWEDTAKAMAASKED